MYVESFIPIDIEFRASKKMRREREKLARREEILEKKMTDLERGQTVQWGEVRILSRQELRLTKREIARIQEEIQRGVGGIFLAVNKHSSGEISPVNQLLPNSIIEQEKKKWHASRRIRRAKPSQPLQ